MYLRDGSAQTSLRAATLRQKLQIKLSTSLSHSILTPGQPAPALTLERQAPGRVATGVPIFKSLVLVVVLLVLCIVTVVLQVAVGEKQ